jgi:hypothetical protein
VGAVAVAAETLRFVAAQLEALLWDAAEKRFTRR